MFRRSKGMSLIEVIIALAVFSIISLFTVSSTTQGFKISKKTSVESDYYHTLRTALRHIERDVSLAFHAFSDTKLGEQYRKQKIELYQLNDDYVMASVFIGTRDKLTFTSSSHRRMYRNTRETDTCEVSYYVDRALDNPGVNNLYKRESGFIDDKLEEGGNVYVLASDVESVSFKYFSSRSFTKEGKWLEKWDSTEGDSANTFPEAVEVTLVLKHPFLEDKKLTVIEQIKVLNPNNNSVLQLDNTEGQQNVSQPAEQSGDENE
ncbi:MAG: prepilin-type N-terminal cleavage/methylation domain-containing protein [Oligoflexia bacterium]|nr:prepilin-type N-terminal cleavage/methylation domain-containing protein [Oligoflexia bacterium]